MRLSVIIPTRNRAARLGALLDSLAVQVNVAFEWETIVVDNGSTDATANIVRQKSTAFRTPLRYVLEERPGLHQGRHRGAREAQGEYLGYLDDDTVLASTWVQGVSLLEQGKAEAVVGRILPNWEAPPPPWLLVLFHEGTLAYLTLLDLGNVPRPVDPGKVWGASFFIPRKLVFDLGGFHPDSMPPDLLRYRGDGENGLMWKFKEAGLRAWYDPAATVYHAVSADRMTIEYLCSRAYSQGISNSFSHIRASRLGGPLPDGIIPEDQTPNSHNVPRSFAAWLTTATRGLKCFFGQALQRTPMGKVEIEKRLAEAYFAGWRFHQNAVRSDGELLAYVLKQNYLDD